MGTIAPSKYHNPRDRRVYLKPAANTVVLATSTALGTATVSRVGGLDEAVTPEHVPAWVRKVEELAAATDSPDAPWAMAHITSIPKNVQIPRSVRVPGPTSISLYLVAEKKGFVLRGKALFGSESRARLFHSGITQAQGDAMSSLLNSTLLRQFQAYNAVKGLSLKQKGDTVTFATSLSIADMRAIFGVAADWSKRYFERNLAGTP
jgi:hypothetical protein